MSIAYGLYLVGLGVITAAGLVGVVIAYIRFMQRRRDRLYGTTYVEVRREAEP